MLVDLIAKRYMGDALGGMSERGIHSIQIIWAFGC